MLSFYHDPKQADGLSFNRIRGLYLDNAQNVWIGGDGGINLLETSATIFEHYAHDSNIPTTLSNNQVRTMILDEQDFLWVGTLGGGLDQMRRVAGKGWETVQKFQSVPNTPNTLPTVSYTHLTLPTILLV